MTSKEEKTRRANSYVQAHDALYATLGILDFAILAVSVNDGFWVGGVLAGLGLAAIAYSERKMRAFIDNQ